MKSMTCDVCDIAFEADTFEEWVEQMKPHYGSAHADVMAKHMSASQEENMKKMREWMDAARVRFEAL